MSWLSHSFNTLCFVTVYHGITNCPYMKGRFDKMVWWAHTIAKNPPPQ